MPTVIIPAPPIVPVDFIEYARYFLLSKIPQLRGPDRSTDLDDSRTDWTGNGGAFPNVEPGGSCLLDTAVANPASATVKAALNNVEYLTSMLCNIWGVAARSKSYGTTANSRAAFLAVIRFGGANTIGFGVNGAQSTDFLSAWFTSGTAISNVIPVLTTIPYLGKEIPHEVYATYNGNAIDLWGGGDFAKGIEPKHGGELNEHSVMLDQPADPGIWLQTIDGVTTELSSCGMFVGKCGLFS
jgi:hypothetical protein